MEVVSVVDPDGTKWVTRSKTVTIPKRFEPGNYTLLMTEELQLRRRKATAEKEFTIVMLHISLQAIDLSGRSKCTYCNFNKYVNPRQPPHDRLLNAMTREIKYYLSNDRYSLKDRPIHSVYFGGGTPSLARVSFSQNDRNLANNHHKKPSTIAQLLETIDKYVRLPSDIEVTLEANPTSVETSQLKSFRDAGVNRLSLGIQSFRDKDLRLLGRDHSANDGMVSIIESRKIFDKVTFDLIFARPGQSLKDWRNELKQGLEIAGDHLSLYQLTVERSTPLHKLLQKGLLAPIPSADEAADMYEETVKTAKEHGFTHYEVSNYCRNEAAISRHNFAYWQGLDYIGIGPGAHGRLTETDGRRIRTFGEFHPDKYMTLCESEGEGIRQMVPITAEEMIQELIVFGMRTLMGVTRSRFRQMTGGQSLDDAIDQDALKLFVDSGFLIDDKGNAGDKVANYIPKPLQYECEEGSIRPTEEGLARMDSILAHLLKK
ncbi:hypothetical protein EC973_003367 [Apophysomyces ossiformis]|uniref:Radical S-adenosyl methionine domain-containing protein 1, mitochondrial n=1 Tax=Apophysomyces ossiformis TaxID=679940 RepID=A0A8H7BT43_9FUNG|nr:hypothetical protein EC973_003367 [Apophysomyces ossiformis]